MKRFLCLVLTALTAVLCFCGCNGSDKTEEAESGNMTCYEIKDTFSMYDLTFPVYSYNTQCTSTEDRIDIVEFESEEALKNKLSTELMSGGGPDLIPLSLLDIAGISYDKLIEQGCFADIDEILASDNSDDKLNLSDYNQKALEGGVYDGKRYAIPFYYIPDFCIASKQELSKYADIKTKALSYNDAIDINEKLQKENKQLSENSGALIYSYVFDCIDFKNKTFSFDGDFPQTAQKLKNLYSSYEYSEEVLFKTELFSPYEAYDRIAELESDGGEPAVLGEPSLNTGEYSAQLAGVYFINKNSKHKDKALKFLKYSLSEEAQNDSNGASIPKYNSDYSNLTGAYYPVNIASYNKLMQNAASVKYLDDTVNISEESASLFEEKLSEITNYRLPQSTNYMAEVGNDLISDYLDGKITVDKFVSGLKSKTKLYLEE